MRKSAATKMAEQHLKALGCRERLAILRALLAGERTARELADELEAAVVRTGERAQAGRDPVEQGARTGREHDPPIGAFAAHACDELA